MFVEADPGAENSRHTRLLSDALSAAIADDEAGVSEARVTLSDMTLYVDGSWEGWSGDTIVQLTDGSVWRQDEYHYEYHYAYRPAVTVSNGQMLVKEMRSRSGCGASPEPVTRGASRPQ
jgi:hypothetical protein